MNLVTLDVSTRFKGVVAGFLKDGKLMFFDLMVEAWK